MTSMGDDISLTDKLVAALAFRDKRQTRRRIPGTHTGLSSSSAFIDFSSTDYLSLATSKRLRKSYLQRLSDAPDILGQGGSRLLFNSEMYDALEERIKKFFRSEAALIFNSGYNANVGFFSCIPQAGDVIVHDEYIHASVYDGMRASRVRDSLFPFSHNSLPALRDTLSKLLEDRPGLRSGANSVLVAIESLYSMDGTFAPLLEIVELLESLFPRRNAYLVVDEAHCTGIYGPQGRGRVVQLGLESRVFARVHTFSKSLSSSGSVILTSDLVREYLINYARPLTYTGSLTYSNVIAIDCAFDLLEDGTAYQLGTKLLDLSSHLVSLLLPKLDAIPSGILTLPPHLTDPGVSSPPSMIIPLLTPLSLSLTEYLFTLGMNTAAITPPVIPAGKEWVRITVHAGNTKEDVEKLAVGIIQWAEEALKRQAQDGKRRIFGLPSFRNKL